MPGEKDKDKPAVMLALEPPLSTEEQEILEQIKFPTRKILDMVRLKKISIDTVDAWLGEAKLSLQTRMRVAAALANAS